MTLVRVVPLMVMTTTTGLETGTKYVAVGLDPFQTQQAITL